MTTWFTSDLHFDHINIITYSRPYLTDIDEMNKLLIDRYNDRVNYDDLVFFLGDICMGKREISLNYIHRLRGYKVLVPGNHDNIHPLYAARSTYQDWMEKYKAVFDDIIPDGLHHYADYDLCHLPYDVNENERADRNFGEHEPKDSGVPLLCGHEHNNWKHSFSKKGTFMYNVGVDVHNLAPVSYEEIVAYHTAVTR